jgi:putative ABC transport system permease protein
MVHARSRTGPRRDDDEVTRGGDALGRGPNPVLAKAPLLLFRYPGSLVALAVAALLLSLAIAAYPLFISSSASRLVRAEIEKPLITRYGAGVTYRAADVSLSQTVPAGSETTGPLFLRRDQLFAGLVARDPRLGPPVATVLGPTVSVSPADRPERFRTGALFAGTAALDHVQILRGAEGPGVWLPDLIAEAVGAGPGDAITLRGRSGETVSTTVDGVYDALYSRPRTGYWLKWAPSIYPSCRDCDPPPQFVLADRSQLVELSGDLGADRATFLWQAPVEPGARLSLDDARELAGFLAGLRTEMARQGTEVGRVFDCCFALRSGQEVRLQSSIGTVITQVEQRVAAVEAPGEVLRTAAMLVALAVLGGAAAFGLAARGTEGRLLFARGTGPAAAGLKAGLEAMLPCLAGSAAGLGLALLLPAFLGPSAPLASTALRAAVRGSILAAVLSITVVALVSGASVLGHVGEHRARLGLVARLPWEVALLGLALFAIGELRSARPVPNGPLQRPSSFLLIFPVALIGGVGLLGARLFREGSRSLRDRSRRFRPSPYLAVQRLAGAPDLTVLLVAASALCLGVFVQAQTVVDSLQTTVEAKARIFVGADTQAWVAGDAEAPPGANIPITRVIRRPMAGITVPGGEAFDLLGVDADTLASAAYWNDDFSDRPLPEIARLLQEPTPGAVPVVVAGPRAAAVSVLEVGVRRIPVEVVARADAFPGMLSERPMVVVDTETLADVSDATVLQGSNALTELWLRGSRNQAQAALAGLDFPPYQVVTATEVEDIPYIAAVIDTFVVLNALGLATAVLVLAALVVYLQARQRSQVVAFGLSLRMGMDDATHRRSLFLELGSMLAAAAVLAIGLALGSSFLMIPRLDPLGAIPPEPLVDVPVLRLGVVVFGLLVAAVLGARLAHRRARVAHLGEVMRVAE